MNLRFCSYIAALFLIAGTAAGDRAIPLIEPPEARSHTKIVSLTLIATLNADGKDSFAYKGSTIAPTIRVYPGDTMKIAYVNHLPDHSSETCAINPCKDMTNLHFHGLEVSPQAPQDDVIDMMAMPGQTLHYVVEIPREHAPGLFWYHTHPHGESHRQALDGMSGAIVIEGIERYYPEVRNLREQILVVRGVSTENDPNAAALLQKVNAQPPSCGNEPEATERVFTVNGQLRPTIGINPGERQFWRVVNASADQYVDLQLATQKLEIIAMDGMPLAFHDPQNPKQIVEHALIAPAGRLEAIVTGPGANANATLRTLCVNTGPSGDPNPEMVLADVRPGSPSASRATHETNRDLRKPEFKQVDLQSFEKTDPNFVVIFTEDKNGFYINGQKYSPDAAPMTTVHIGGYQHWRIFNMSGELHPMHIHQTHFLVYSQNGVHLDHPIWMDTVNVPTGGSVDVVMDFTDPIIKGMSLFHCHLLNHEDKGMMAKVLFQ